MADIQVRHVTQSLPAGFCPATEQERLNAYFQYVRSTLAVDATVWNIGSTTPAPEKRMNPWLRLNPADGTLDRSYVFALGAWVSPHLDFTGKVALWEGNIANIATLDGGSAGAVTATTGPFWEEVTEARGRFPLHPDTGPVLLTAAVAVGATGGEEKHTTLLAEIPAHQHVERAYSSGGGSGLWSGSAGVSTEFDTPNSTAPSGGDGTGATTPHNNMPPYYGIWMIRRTARKYYSIPG